jgi:hypothetical protein
MPLTLPTHPLAVVPLKLWRPRWFDGVALAMGAIAPDVAYAAYGLGPAIHTHNLPALLWWALPVTLLLTRLVRWAAPPIAAHLPARGPLRLADYAVLGSVRHPWRVTVLSALLGSLSHLLWDAVTHPGYLPALRAEVWPGKPWWGLFSDVSDLTGFAAGTLLLLHLGRTGLLREWHGPPPRTRSSPAAFWLAGAATFGIGLTVLLVHPTSWFAAQAIRIMLIAGLALLAGAAAARLAAQRGQMAT